MRQFSSFAVTVLTEPQDIQPYLTKYCCPVFELPAGEKASIWSFNYFFYNKVIKFGYCDGLVPSSAHHNIAQSHMPATLDLSFAEAQAHFVL